MNPYYNTRPDVVDMVLLCSGAPTTHTTEEAWRYLEKTYGVIKDSAGRAAWKDPTPTGKRMIGIGFTKVGDSVYDGSIRFDGKRVAVFRFGKFDE
jgi:hypothetical protein